MASSSSSSISVHAPVTSTNGEMNQQSADAAVDGHNGENGGGGVSNESSDTCNGGSVSVNVKPDGPDKEEKDDAHPPASSS